MKRLISFKTSVTITIVLLILVTLFNLTVIVGLTPYDMVWGGRLKSKEEMIFFEMVSILINFLSLLLVLIKSRRLFTGIGKIADILIWVLPILYFFGIIGNAMSTSAIEKVLFVPTTLLLFLLTVRIAIEKVNPLKKENFAA